MKFDVVVGNPPYNNDIYIPFVELGHNLSSICSVWITPAKWQAKGGKDNEAFRQNIVPHMSKIVYYPDTTEIFDIAEVDGISYYLIDKDIHGEKYIENVFKKIQAFNNKSIRSINNNINNTLISILEKVNAISKNKISFEFKSSPFGFKSGENLLLLNDGDIKILANKGFDYSCSIDDIRKNMEYVDDYKLVMNHFGGYSCFYDKNNGMTYAIPDLKVLKPREVTSFSYVMLYHSKNINAVLSAKSYYETRLIRFIIRCGLASSTLSSQENWRFVPDPGTFDHIFTDEELYKKYNLTQEEINIIESVIKERK